MSRIVCVGFGLTVLVVVAWFGVHPCFGQDREIDTLAKSEKKTPQRDPVADAFTIPYGTVLNEKQRSEYERLKADKESALRDATDALASATSSAEKTNLRKQIYTLEHEIRAGIQQILLMPYNEALQAQQKKVMEQGYATYGPAGYSGGYYAVPGWYGYGSYGPPWGYPGYGSWYDGHYWHKHHNYVVNSAPLNQPVGYTVNKPVGTNKSTTSAKASGTNATVNTPTKPNPPPKPHNPPAKHR